MQVWLASTAPRHRFHVSIALLLALTLSQTARPVKVQDEGVLLGSGWINTINCSGAGITCTRDAVSGTATLTVTSGGGGGGSTPSVSCTSGQALSWNGSTWSCINKIQFAWGADAGVTAQSLAADPTDCSAGQYATAIASSGNLTCAQVAYSQVSGTPTIPTDISGASYLTKVAEASLSNEFALGTLATGLLKNTTTTGVPTIAVAGTDYAPATSGSAVLLGNGAGGFSAYAGTSCTNQFPRSLSTAGAATCASVSLSADVTGNLPVTNLGSGTSASSTTFWRGDATWATPPGTGTRFMVTGADYTNSTTTPSTITNLTWSVTSGTPFGFACLILSTGTATSLVRYNINGPTMTNFAATTQRYTTTAAQTLLVLQAVSAAAQTAACTTACNTTILPTIITGSGLPSANGTITVQGSSSTAAQSVTVHRGSYCIVY